MNKAVTVVGLFSGPGGLAEGFVWGRVAEHGNMPGSSVADRILDTTGIGFPMWHPLAQEDEWIE